MIRRNQRYSRANGGNLTKPSDHELGCAVHDIGLELRHRCGDAPVCRRCEANVRVGRERRAREFYMEVRCSEVIDELPYASRRVWRIARRYDRDPPSAL